MKKSIYAKLILVTFFTIVLSFLAIFSSFATADVGEVQLFEEEIGIAIGSTYKLEAFGGYDNKNYTSGDNKIATVDSSGTITGVAKGQTTITVSDGSTSAQVNVVVTKTAVVTDRYALELYVGETDTLTATVTGKKKSVKWKSSDENIVTVENGKLTAVSVGNATITVTAGDGEYKVPVYVVEKEFSFDENILISIFWPPTQGYINDEQYKLLSDADIDWVMSSGDNLGSESVQKNMLQLCYKYGMHMTVADSGLGSNLLSASEQDITAIVKKYKNLPGANGYYMLDEPFNPNTFIEAYKTLNSADASGAYMHLNFLSYASYSDIETYKKQMNDWLKLCAASGNPQEYLIYDLYPYGTAEGSMNREAFITNLEAVREIGLRNNVKTGTYIQSVAMPNSLRSPNEAETRYEINMSLAFGVKQLSYFTWFTPTERDESFDDGIISSDGVPNEKYEFICKLNQNVHNVGKTLINCDALEVYQSKTEIAGVSTIPDEFFVHSSTNNADFTVSYLRDNTTGRNYCMVVNNNFTKAKSFDLEFDDKITSLEYISFENGELLPLEMKDNCISLELEAGGAIILALPESFDYSAGDQYTPEDGENLALHAEITCDSSTGSNKEYIDNLNDGLRFDTSSAKGWCSNTDSGTANIVIDFGEALTFNRIDLYPCGTVDDYGTAFPKALKIRYSNDGNTWTTVASMTDIVITDETVPSIKFDSITARYVKIQITEFNGDFANINEIEIYNDSGNVAAPTFVSDIVSLEDRGEAEVVSYTEGANIALNKKVIVSSYPINESYKEYGWWPDFVCDGDESTGWTSDVKIHTDSVIATEYCVIDLGDTFNIEKINVLPKGNWPMDFQILISSNGYDWTTVASQKKSKSGPFNLTLDGSEHARFVMFKATKLSNTNNGDGYLLQLGEIEVYGTPYVNFDEAADLQAKYLSAGGTIESENYKTLEELLNKDNVTQNEVDKALVNMLSEVNLTLETDRQLRETFAYNINYGPFDDEEDDAAEEGKKTGCNASTSISSVTILLLLCVMFVSTKRMIGYKHLL